MRVSVFLYARPVCASSVCVGRLAELSEVCVSRCAVLSSFGSEVGGGVRLVVID